MVVVSQKVEYRQVWIWNSSFFKIKKNCDNAILIGGYCAYRSKWQWSLKETRSYTKQMLGKDFLIMEELSVNYKREFQGRNSRARLLNYLKWRNQYAFSIDAYPHAKNQYHSSRYSWHIAALIMGIAFGMLSCAGPKPYKWTELNRCTHVWQPTYKNSI